MSHSIKAVYGNSPRAAVAFVVPPPRCFIPLRRRLLLVYVAVRHLSNQSPTSALLRGAGPRCYGDGATAILRSATWVMPPASLGNVRYQPSHSGANAGSVQWNIVLSFYGRKMQPIQRHAIILNTLLPRLTLKKMKPTPARPFRLSV